MKVRVIVCTGISIILVVIFIFINEEKNKMKEKKTSFECGYDRLSPKKTTFSTNFLILIMIFLIFDVEVTILIPFVTINKNNNKIIMELSIVFISLLIILIVKEWKQGSLEWRK